MFSTTATRAIPLSTMKVITPTSVPGEMRGKEETTSIGPATSASPAVLESATPVVINATISVVTSTAASPINSESHKPATVNPLESESKQTEDISRQQTKSSRITPAFGVAGVILIVSGLVHTFVGIKFSWLHPVVSVAYLGALSTTVLIIHVSDPPVSDAIQGAYLVAIVMTGAILGGASYFFCRFTAGLTSFLGGSCLAMWLLVMRSDGLITSQGGKMAFILIFALVAYSTSFFRSIRDYGLIVSIPLGGATSVVLGIDCFTGAGLKDFWAYLWNANPSLLANGVRSYPLTKGLKIEISAVAFIFLLGLFSQIKLWLAIQKHQARRCSGKLDLEEGGNSTSCEDTSPARNIEQQTAREIPQWTGAFDEKALPDPGQHPATIYGSSADVDVKHKTRWTTSTLRGSEYEFGGSPTRNLSAITSLDVIQPVTESVDIHNHLAISSAATAPNEFPLPYGRFHSGPYEDDKVSVATTVEDQVEMRQRSARFSATSAFLRRLSKRSHRHSQAVYRGDGDSSEDLVSLKTANNNRFSSVTATFEDLSDNDDFRSARSSINQMSPYRAEFNRASNGGAASPRTPNFSLKVPGSRLSRPFSGVTAASKLDADPLPSIAHEQIRSFEVSLSDGKDNERRSSQDDLTKEAGVETHSRSPAESISTPPQITISRKALPDLPREIMAHCTDKPAEELKSTDVSDTQELATCVDLTTCKSQKDDVALDISNLPETSYITVPAASFQPERATASRQESSNLLPLRSDISRTTSNQVAGDRTFSHLIDGFKHEPAPVGRRDLGMKGRPFQGTGTQLATMPEFPRASLTSSEATSNMYLNPLHWSSHQPKYQPTIPNPMLAREQKMAMWRSTLTQEAQYHEGPRSSLEMSRNALTQERLAREHKRESAARMKSIKDATHEEQMRRGEMLEEHREALKKMQARANRSA